MHRASRTTAWLTALSALALAGCAPANTGAQSSACPVSPDDSITTTVRIAYQNIPNGDLVVKDNGWLESCMPNASISWAKYNSGGDVIQAFGSDSADLGLIGSSPATKALSAPLNIDMKVVWIFDVIGDAESLVVRGDEKSITELEGKTIAVPFASTSHYSLLGALEAAGMDPNKDVKLVNLSPDAMPAAWERGDIDAAWVWDPTLSELKKTGTVILSAAETAKQGRPTFDLAGATSSFVADNPAFMDMWTVLQDRAVSLIHSDPTSAAESISVELGNSPDDVKQQLKGYTFLSASDQAGADYFGGGMGDAIIGTATFLKSQGEIDAISPDTHYRDAIYASSIQKAAG